MGDTQLEKIYDTDKNVIPTIYGYLLPFAAENGAKKKKKTSPLSTC